MNQSGFYESQTRGGVPGQAKVGVLINGTRYETGHIGVSAEHDREAGGEARGGLHGRKGGLADVVGIGETEYGLCLIVSDGALDAQDILIQRADVGGIGEDEGLVRVESDGDDVLCVFAGEVDEMLNGRRGFVALWLFCEKKLFIIRQLNDARYMERLLKICGEDEGDKMTEMQGGGGGATAGVQEELFARLVAIEKQGEIAVGEEDAAAEKEMRRLTGEGLEAR